MFGVVWFLDSPRQNEASAGEWIDTHNEWLNGEISSAVGLSAYVEPQAKTRLQRVHAEGVGVVEVIRAIQLPVSGKLRAPGATTAREDDVVWLS